MPTETRYWTSAAVLALALIVPAWPARGQEPAIVGVGADVRVFREGEELPAGAQLGEGDEIRTGPSSFAQIDVGGARLVLGADTSLTLASSPEQPSIRLDRGVLEVTAGFEGVEVQSTAGRFVLPGSPAQARFEVVAGRLAVQVLTGEVQAEALDSGALLLRGPGERAARSFTAGFTEGFKQTIPAGPAWSPNVYLGYPSVQPYNSLPAFPIPVR